MSILNDTTPRLTRHVSDHHAVQGEAEYVERHAPITASPGWQPIETAQMTPERLLQIYDDLMESRRILTRAERDAFGGLLIAATFAAAAYDAINDRDAAIAAMLRTFLVALVDPNHRDLDHLRAAPEAEGGEDA